MKLREDQKERLLEYFFNSDVAYLVEFIMENTYDSNLENLANELLGDEEETAELEAKNDTN
jgi:hypothetical protein